MTDTWQIYPTVYEVAGRRRERLVLVVVTCPQCRQSHVHTARASFTRGQRTAACGARYVVLVKALERAA